MDDTRAAERFDEGAERFLREIAGAPPGLEIEAAAPVGAEPPWAVRTAMDPRQTATRTELDDWEAGQGARLLQRAQ